MNKALLTLAGFLLATTVQAQTCNANIVKTKPDSQYTVSADGTEVTDTKTGLIWQRCALGTSWNGTTCSGAATPYNWENALAQAASVATNSSVAWRLPNLKELKSLVETACTGQAINETIFPATPNALWSSSAFAYDAYDAGFVGFDDGNGSNLAWGVDFDVGNGYWNVKDDGRAVRLVRSQ